MPVAAKGCRVKSGQALFLVAETLDSRGAQVRNKQYEIQKKSQECLGIQKNAGRESWHLQAVWPNPLNAPLWRHPSFKLQVHMTGASRMVLQ